MLKKFFISMLGTMAGLWLSFFIFIVLGAFTIGVVMVKTSSSKSKSDGSILHIDMTGIIPEREAELSFSDILSFVEGTSDDLASILEAIKTAADDKKIKGIYITCDASQLGVASRSEIIEAIKDFKSSGKWVYAYADNYEMGDYYVASAADSVFLNPVGMTNFHGLSGTVIFFKDVLNKLGIDVDVVRVGSFKSAVEPYMRMDMSPESRMQMSIYLNQIWDNMVASIAENRGIVDSNRLNVWADSLAFTWPPKKYVDCKMISSLKYRSEVEDMLRDLVDADHDDDLPLITPTEYLELRSMLEDRSSNHVAVLYAVGDIVDTGETGIVGDKMVDEIHSLANDDKVKALVLRVNSPGGSAFASEQIWHALEDFKSTGKPFYVSMSDYAASGGYYISCGADKIYCDPSTITGSIGIFGVIPNAQTLLQKKIGLGFETVETNKNSNFPSLYTSPNQEQLAGMQAYVERGYDTFTSRVAAGRNIPVDSVKAIGGGRVWDGISALKIGLVDELGGLQDAVRDICYAANISTDRVIAYPIIDATLINTLLKETSGSISIDIDGVDASQIKDIYNHVNKIKNLSPVQARMETIILN